MIFRGIHWSDRPFSDPGGARTHDPMIKSHLLYQLSHGVIALEFECQRRCLPHATLHGTSLSICGAKLDSFIYSSKFFYSFFIY